VAALDIVGGVLLGLCVLLVAFVVRRWLLVRSGGAIEMSWRLRHWTYGVARYDGNRLLWFATFSLRPGPTRTLPRTGLRIVARRDPHGAEAWTLVPHAVVLECRTPRGPVQIALPPAATLGFLAWVEAGPTLRLPEQDRVSLDSPTAAT
jgi:hypothetical protein